MTGWGRSPARLRPRQTGGDRDREDQGEASQHKGSEGEGQIRPQGACPQGTGGWYRAPAPPVPDAAQQGRQDGYGEDRIEDTAAGGARRVERGVGDLLKRRRKFEGGRTYSTEPPTSGRGDTVHGQTVWGHLELWEATGSSTCGEGRGAVSPPDGGNTRSAARLEHCSVKTKDTYIQGQTPSVQGLSREQREFAQERGRAQAKKRAGRFGPHSARKYGPGNGVATPPETTGIKAGSTGKAGARQATRQTVKTAENASRSIIKTAKEAVKTAHQAGTTAQRTAQAAIRAPQRAAQAAA